MKLGILRFAEVNLTMPSSALAAYGAYREVKGLVNGISGLASADSISATGVAKALGASVSVSLGVQKSESKSHSDQSTSAGSGVAAGGTVKLTATGQGKDSDISLTHATVAGQQGTHLKADGDILAQAGVNTAHVNNSNKSSGASIGVSFGTSGFTLNASVNGGKGVANGDETTYSETTIGNANSNTTLASGADTVLDGAIVQGKQITADVGGNLIINTPQDVSHYDSKQTSYGVGVSIPLGAGAFGVSGSFSNDKVHANTNTTQEIAGIHAGEGGYAVTVKGNTTLDAGVIASTATPDKNQLTTSTLILKDKANNSEYDANSVGLSASYSGKQTTTDAKGNTVPKMITNDKGEQVQAQGGMVKGFGANLPSTMSASDDASSSTRAAISNGSITITNDAAQQQLTGQTAEQTLASINHDTANNATLTNLYEQDKDSIQTGFAISKGLTQNFATFMNDMAQDMDSVAKSPAVGKDGKPIIGADGKPMTNQQAYQAGLELGDTVNKAGDTINYGTRQDLWGSGGTGNRIATALIGAYSGNVSNGASTLLQNTAINVVRSYGATEIKHLADGFSTQTDDKGNPIPNGTSETVRGLLHAIAGCAGAAATGGDCASAGLASAGTVAMNNAMTALLNLNPNEMTDTQKQAYSNLIGTLVAGVSTAVGGDAAAAQLASKVEVENNAILYAPGTFANRSDVDQKLIVALKKYYNDSNFQIIDLGRDLKNTDKDRQILADALLAAILPILENNANEPIVLVGHSHGGNAIKIVTNKLIELGYQNSIDNIMLLATPETPNYQLNNSALTTNALVINAYDNRDNVQTSAGYTINGQPASRTINNNPRVTNISVKAPVNSISSGLYTISPISAVVLQETQIGVKVHSNMDSSEVVEQIQQKKGSK